MSTEQPKENIKRDVYDTTFILSSILILILFSVLEESLSCSIQELLKNNYVKHIIGMISIFFMYAIVGNKEKQHITAIWVKSLLMYIIFVLMAKSKWYFAVPVVVLLLIDQSIKIHSEHLNSKDDKYDKKNIDRIRKIITGLIFILIFSGAIFYGIHHYQDNRHNSDILNLFFSIGCKEN